MTSHSCRIETTPDGFMICGPHAQTAAENMQGGTVSSMYVIAHQSLACVVDTGRFDASYQALARELRARGLGLHSIILTHDHYDHVGNAERLRREFGGRILAHALDAPLVRDPLLLYDHEKMTALYGASLEDAWQDMELSPGQIEAMRRTTEQYYCEPVSVDEVLEADTAMDLAGLEVRLLHTPGHSPGGLSVHVPATGSVYTGDLTFWVNPCRPAPIGDGALCLESLEKILALRPRYCGPGHGPGVPQPESWLVRHMELHRTLARDILERLRSPRRVAQLRAEIFPADPPDSFAPIPENSIQAWLASLLRTGRVARDPSRPALWHRTDL